MLTVWAIINYFGKHLTQVQLMIFTST